jgi:hypothetical protein
VPRPQGEQAVLATLSHSGPRVSVALLRLPTREGWGGVGWGGWKGFRLPSRPRGSEHLPAQGRLCGPCYTRSTRAAPRARGPAGTLARGIARTPPEGGRRAARRYAGVELRLVGVHALVVREQLAQPRPSHGSREVEPLDYRAEVQVARVLLQEPRSSRAVGSTGMYACAPSSHPSI